MQPQRKANIHNSHRVTVVALGVVIFSVSTSTAPAQFNYTTINGTITITGYTGPGGAVAIPSMIGWLPVTDIGSGAFDNCISLTSVTIPNSVTSIGLQAFHNCTNLTNVTIGNRVGCIGDLAFDGCINLASVTIPNSVTNIGGAAFNKCISLTSVTIPGGVISIVVGPGEPGPFVFCTRLSAITVDPLNPAYTSLDGVLFNKDLTILIECPGAKTGSYTVPGSVTNIAYAAFAGCSSLTSVAVLSSVTSIGDWAFFDCANLNSVAIPDSVSTIGRMTFGECITLGSITIPDRVTSLGDDAFYDCTNLTGVHFKGNAPSFGLGVFDGDDNATAYYLPGTTGWGTTFGGRPTALWNPSIQTTNASPGVRTNQFGFTITGTTNIPIVVEASTELATASWTPLQTCTLTNGSIYFSDPQWTNYPVRFYRLRSP